MKTVKINCKKYFGVNKATTVFVSVEMMQKSTKFKTLMLESELEATKAQLKLKNEADQEDDSDPDEAPELSLEEQIAEIEKQIATDEKDTAQRNKVLAFIQETMRYSEKQMTQIADNHDDLELVQGAVYIYYRIQGMTDKDLDSAKEAEASKK
ncbi:phage tail tube assembly chaperone [Lactiplantibacillus paraxiangfangensis]|uniref:phage tail tube assembly chaperone n=1 Tax=Lactiplantibacillus paraxiangfangensis TaxID=3076224 RepID=UPI0030C765F6